jgi:hypothetical protein
MAVRAQKGGASYRSEELPPGYGVQTAISGDGRRIVVGDRVMIHREGWRGKVGVYLGRDYKNKKLKVRFEEFGGALLLCHGWELRRMDIVGSENPITIDEQE